MADQPAEQPRVNLIISHSSTGNESLILVPNVTDIETLCRKALHPYAYTNVWALAGEKDIITGGVRLRLQTKLGPTQAEEAVLDLFWSRLVLGKESAQIDRSIDYIFRGMRERRIRATSKQESGSQNDEEWKAKLSPHNPPF